MLARLKRLETVRAVEESNRRLKIEFAYLKLLPREYEGPRHVVKMGQRPDGRDECEERPDELTAIMRRNASLGFPSAISSAVFGSVS